MKPLAAVLCLLFLPLAALAAPVSAASIERFLALTEAEKNLEAAQRYSEQMMQEAMREQNQRRMLSPAVQDRMREAMEMMLMQERIGPLMERMESKMREAMAEK